MADAGLRPEVAETHTGLVVLVGDLAYKMKKSVVTDFLDFSTIAARERTCAHEIELNRRLAPDSYLGLGHFQSPQPGAAPEPVIVMRRYPDALRLASMIRRGEDVTEPLTAIAGIVARFHARAHRGRDIDREATVEAVTARWQENLGELGRYAAGVVPGVDPGLVADIGRRALGFLARRAELFWERISGQRIVDGHADLLADDIFCLPEGPALLDCLEFDDRLRYVDGVDDAAFLAMDLEFMGRPDLAALFLRRYLELAQDDAPESLQHFYIAYRAVVRAKVECVRYTQGRTESADDACRHLTIALDHLRAGAVQLIMVGGGPGTGKTTLARALAYELGAQVISTDDVRAGMVARGEITGEPGVLGAGLYSQANIDAVYDAVLRQAQRGLAHGRTVILDGTWADPRQRQRARDIAADSPLIEFACAASLDDTVSRIRTRTDTTSQVTPEIATALAARDREHGGWEHAHRIDTTRELSQSVAEALDICRGR